MPSRSMEERFSRAQIGWPSSFQFFFPDGQGRENIFFLTFICRSLALTTGESYGINLSDLSSHANRHADQRSFTGGIPGCQTVYNLYLTTLLLTDPFQMTDMHQKLSLHCLRALLNSASGRRTDATVLRSHARICRSLAFHQPERKFADTEQDSM